MQLRKESLKKIQLWMGFEPMTSVMLVQCSINCAIMATGSNGHSILCSYVFLRGSRDVTVVRALAFHQCGPSSIPGLDVICGLSLLLVLIPSLRVFLRVLQLSSLNAKTNISKFQFDLETVERRATPLIPLKFPFHLFFMSFSCCNFSHLALTSRTV